MTQLSPPAGTLSRSGDDPVLDHLGFLTRVRVSGDQTQQAFGLIEQRGVRGAGCPTHRHSTEAETFIILDGTLEAWSPAGTTAVSSGDVVRLPAGQDHAFRVTSEQARFLVLVTPGGFEQFFAQTGRALAGSFEDAPPPVGPPPTDEQVAVLAGVLATYGVELTGPPPW